MLSVNSLKSGYNGVEIISDISLEVKEKQVVAIVGANGAGKSTLLKTIFGLIKSMGGEITFDGKRIDNIAPNKVVESGLSLVPEGRQLFPHLTVLENLEVGSSMKALRAKRKDSMEEVFALFPKLHERIQQYAGTLSGGEQQMVAIARALMARPKLLVMDEPSWGLAPILVKEIFENIVKIKETGTSVLLVEQNVSQSLQISDYGYVMESGSVTIQGPGSELLANSDLKKAYMGL